MSIIRTMRKQKAVYWKAGSLDMFGQPSFSPPVEIECRWEEDSKEFIDETGSKQVSKSVVYVDRDMATGDFLKLGELDSLQTETLPQDGAFIIRGWNKLPNMKATEFLRTAYL